MTTEPKPEPERVTTGGGSIHADDCLFEVKHEIILCEVCGTPTTMQGTKRCNDCWEVEYRLPNYLLSPQAWEFIRQHLLKLDNWKDSKPDAWDYEAVLREHRVIVDDSDGLGWSLHWQQGVIHIGETTEIIARKAAALFVSLWLRGVSASFCDKLMDGYICFLEQQENKSLTFSAFISRQYEPESFFRLTRKGFCHYKPLNRDTENRIIEALDPQPDEEVIVTFVKRKKQPLTPLQLAGDGQRTVKTIKGAEGKRLVYRSA